MARQDTYRITSAGRRVLDEYRGDRNFGDVFHVIKYDKLRCEAGQYEVTSSTFGEECSCPAAHKPNCRHREMLFIFKEKGQIDGAMFYSYDKKAWYE